MSDSPRFIASVARIDAENAGDPRREIVDGQSEPFEVVYSRRLAAWVRRLSPTASKALLLAAHGQHIGRWQIPRETYPQGLNGYLEWRETLMQFHASKMRAILTDCGYSEDIVAHVESLIKKEKFPDDPEGRVLEDALCLLFIETQLADFAATKPREKSVDIIRKTWEKMTTQARGIALTLPLTPEARALVAEAGVS